MWIPPQNPLDAPLTPDELADRYLVRRARWAVVPILVGWLLLCWAVYLVQADAKAGPDLEPGDGFGLLVLVLYLVVLSVLVAAFGLAALVSGVPPWATIAVALVVAAFTALEASLAAPYSDRDLGALWGSAAALQLAAILVVAAAALLPVPDTQPEA